MNRREAIRRAAIALGGTFSAPTLAGLMGGCGRVRPDAYAPRALSADQFRLVGVLTERIIPETDTPGAAAAAVDVFIDMMLADFYSPTAREQFRVGLEHVNDVARSTSGVPFLRATEERQIGVLEILDDEAYSGNAAGDERAFFRTLKELTVAGYYTSEIGQTVELHLPPFGEFRADIPVDDVGRTWA